MLFFTLKKNARNPQEQLHICFFFFFGETIFCDIILLLFTSAQSAVYQYLAQGLNSELESFSCNI